MVRRKTIVCKLVCCDFTKFMHRYFPVILDTPSGEVNFTEVIPHFGMQLVWYWYSRASEFWTGIYTCSIDILCCFVFYLPFNSHSLPSFLLSLLYYFLLYLTAQRGLQIPAGGYLSLGVIRMVLVSILPSGGPIRVILYRLISMHLLRNFMDGGLALAFQRTHIW